MDLLLHPLGALDASPLLGFFQFFAQIGEPPAIGRLRLLVEHLACITEAGVIDPSLLELVIAPRHPQFRFVPAAGRPSSDQIEHVEFSPRMTYEIGEVSE